MSLLLINKHIPLFLSNLEMVFSAVILIWVSVINAGSLESTDHFSWNFTCEFADI